MVTNECPQVIFFLTGINSGKGILTWVLKYQAIDATALKLHQEYSKQKEFPEKVISTK